MRSSKASTTRGRPRLAASGERTDRPIMIRVTPNEHAMLLGAIAELQHDTGIALTPGTFCKQAVRAWPSERKLVAELRRLAAGSMSDPRALLARKLLQGDES